MPHSDVRWRRVLRRRREVEVLVERRDTVVLCCIGRGVGDLLWPHQPDGREPDHSEHHHAERPGERQPVEVRGVVRIGVEQAQHRVAGAGAGVERRPGGAQARVAVERRDAGHGEQLAAAFVQDQVEAEERLQPPAEARLRLAAPPWRSPRSAPASSSRGGGCGRPRRSGCCAGPPPPSSASFRP